MTSGAAIAGAKSKFQSTCHIRGMTAKLRDDLRKVYISIHMPHTWHDSSQRLSCNPSRISIHMPHTWHDTKIRVVTPHWVQFQSTCHIRGMTLITWNVSPPLMSFQSTCHIRGMTNVNRVCIDRNAISIHMPHTWHDGRPAAQETDCLAFQSTCHIRGMTS